jgi:hypothetical protein
LMGTDGAAPAFEAVGVVFAENAGFPLPGGGR